MGLSCSWWEYGKEKKASDLDIQEDLEISQPTWLAKEVTKGRKVNAHFMGQSMVSYYETSARPY